MNTDPIFEAEQKHLSHTYEKLQTMGRDLLVKMQKNSENAAADKIAMSDELSVNLASYADAMETYADFAAINRVIDAYNITQSVDAEKLSSIQVLLKQPYFAKIVLQFKPTDEPKELYIGTAGMSDESYRRMVVDWRSAVAEVYYNQDNGPTSYEANGRTIHVDLKLRRQFDIEADKLNAYFDTTVAIQDELLLDSLSKRRTAHMQAITATIQKEQNQIIRHDDVPVLLVNGIAGSGKTSVLMQRIAYLFYQQRESLDASEVFLITPNPVFRSYIEQVLPDLGERNPQSLTWGEFLESLMPANRTGGTTSVSREVFKRIDKACKTVSFEDDDFKEIICEGQRFLSPAQIRQVASKFKKLPVGPHMITLMREELLKRVEARFAQMAASEKVLDELSAMSPDEQLAEFHETFDSYDEDEIREWAKRYIENRYGIALAAVENDDWLRVDRIGMRLLDVENLIPVEWLYLKMVLTGLGNSKAKYVMIDEVQDYTEAQLIVLARYFKRAHFMLLGDENQAINPDTASFKEVQRVFQDAKGEFEECRLMTSYRSTSEITQMFAGLLDKAERLKVSSIQRDDKSPEIIECDDQQQYEDMLRSKLEEAKNNDGITAVIVPQKYIAKGMQKRFGSAVPPLMDTSDSLPESGVILVPLKLAKGLEFDHVIITDASEKTFPDDEISRKRLYTTISRATKTLTLLSNGKLTSLLTNKVGQ